ncbi:MAG: hypothetical protein K0Q50_730 [Vampirovibrio sp.]|jgi:hypothetical protein|nr:hypothetical protein [Vampirovibrio sp.]
MIPLFDFASLILPKQEAPKPKQTITMEVQPVAKGYLEVGEIINRFKSDQAVINVPGD